MKYIAGLILSAALITLGLYMLFLWVESIRSKEWFAVIIYMLMWLTALFVGGACALHMKGWI